MPWPSIDANARAVPLMRNGRSQCSMKAGVNGGEPVPQALRRPLRNSQSQSVAMRYALVYQGGRSRCESQAPAWPPGSASPSRSTIPATFRGSDATTATATAAPREWPTSTGRRRPRRLSKPETSPAQWASVNGPRRSE